MAGWMGGWVKRCEPLGVGAANLFLSVCWGLRFSILLWSVARAPASSVTHASIGGAVSYLLDVDQNALLLVLLRWWAVSSSGGCVPLSAGGIGHGK